MSNSGKDKAKGKANELIGKVTGNRTKQAKGKVQQGKGRVKDELKDEEERTKRDAEGR